MSVTCRVGRCRRTCDPGASSAANRARCATGRGSLTSSLTHRAMRPFGSPSAMPPGESSETFAARATADLPDLRQRRGVLCGTDETSPGARLPRGFTTSGWKAPGREPPGRWWSPGRRGLVRDACRASAMLSLFTAVRCGRGATRPPAAAWRHPPISAALDLCVHPASIRKYRKAELHGPRNGRTDGGAK